ncbi:TPA: hypothetical protein QDB28_005216 [Burkholderia vietnamiensis]|uniref:hypothetical protein n=1 Tax=Burkholderia vietnamiensis TaxID=60552 RepID=UPI00158EFB0C|nr:hypothetical protein [Burkholderia vietnamiensis]HDR9164781.1 hypothetical protein [Burkholderia vietnamiensis]
MNDDTQKALQDHILECSQNYGDLRNEVAVQNTKIDTLVQKIHEMDARQKAAFLYAFLGAVTVAWYLIQHYVIK